MVRIIVLYIAAFRKGLKKPMGKSEAIIRIRTENTMVKGKQSDNGKTKHHTDRKQTIEQHKHHQHNRMNSHVPKGLAIPAPLEIPVALIMLKYDDKS